MQETIIQPATTKRRNGRVTGITPRYTARAYLAQQMQPDRAILLKAVDWLDQFLGRPALLSDLNDKTLALFFDWLGDVAELGQSTRLNYQKGILQIGRHAAERNIIPWPMPSWKSRAKRECSSDDPGLFTLLRYFEEVLLVDRNANRQLLSASTIKSYRSAIRAYERFSPSHTNTSCHRVTQKTIRRFRRWLLDNGMNEKKAGNHAFAVAAIVKHARPERFIETAEGLEPAADEKRSLAYVLIHHYLPAKPSIASVLSEKKYLATFQSFGRHLGHVATLDDLTDERVGSYMRSVRASGRSARTANGYRSKLIALWNWCARKRMVEEFPAVEQMPEPKTLPSAWSREQLAALFAACERMPGTIAGVPAAAWWCALHLVSWDTGERTGALLSLTWPMLDFRTGQLVVPAEFRKGGRKPMLYRLKRETLAALRTIIVPDCELIFPFPHCKSDFYYHYRRLLKFAGLPRVPYKSGLQKMRRSFATHLEANGGNATEALAHCERSVTEESYLDPRMIDRQPPNELLFSLSAVR